jgi:hypothetical protein
MARVWPGLIVRFAMFGYETHRPDNGRFRVGSQDPYEQLLGGRLPVYPVGPGCRRWRLWVRIRRKWLDFLIARGVSPGTSPR